MTKYEQLPLAETVDVIKIVAGIEQHDTPGRPQIEMSETARQEFTRLLSLLTEKSGPKMIAVIRCWNKSAEDLRGLRERLKTFQKDCPELCGAMIAVNADGEKEKDASGRPITVAHLDELAAEHDSFSVVPVAIKNYTWTAGLNGPTAMLHAAGREAGLVESDVHTLNLSFDAIFSPGTAKEISQRLREGLPIMTMRIEEVLSTPEETATVRSEYVGDGREGTSEIAPLWDKMLALLRKPEVTPEEVADFYELRSKALVMISRNTALVFSLSDLARNGGFNPACNGWGGMEDHEMFLRLVLEAEEGGDRYEKLMAAAKEPLLFSDPAWNSMPQGDEKKGRVFKYGHEQKALEKIAYDLGARYQARDSGAAFVVPPGAQDFKFV